jgi:hypothetical protein
MDNFDVWTQIIGYCDIFTIFKLKLVSSTFYSLKFHIHWKEQFFYFFEKDKHTTERDWETKFKKVFLKTKQNYNNLLKEYQFIESRFAHDFESLIELLTQIQKEKILKQEDFQNCFSIQHSLKFF